MLNPFDGWTIAHCFAGFFLGRIKLSRWLFYPLPIGLEIYQLYFHYQPQGYYLSFVWLNSLSDILVCLVCYEISMKYSFGYEHHAMWLKISNATKAIMAYALITLGTAFIFWDDIFRGSLPALMPYTKVPAVIGAFSPAVASIMIRTCINWETFPTSRLPWIPFKKFSYYLFAGFLPSMIILLIIFLVTGF